MRIISSTIEIAAAPMDVWRVLADLSSYKDWNPFIQSAAGDLKHGATLTLRLVPGQGRAMTFRPTVLEVQPGSRLRWIGHFIMPGIFDGEHDFTLEEMGRSTRLIQSEKFSGVLVPFARKTLNSTTSDFSALNAALKRRVEHAAEN